MMRRRLSGLQAQQVVFRHGMSGHVIHIQTVAHVAAKSFYETIYEELMKFDGEVHFEGVGSIEDADSSQEDTANLNTVYAMLAAVSGLTPQLSVLSKDLLKLYPEKCKNYDLKLADLGDVLSEADFAELIKSVVETGEKTLSNRLVMSLASLAVPVLIAKVSNNPNSTLDTASLLDKRNAYAIAKAVDTEPNVYMIWGAAHLPGMVELLKSYGYDMVEEYWKTVIPWFNREKESYSDRKRKVRELYQQLQAFQKEVDDEYFTTDSQ